MSSGDERLPRVSSDPARARIAAAMIDLVGTRGYAQTSIEMICEQARARRSHFDRCFAGIEDCFLCVHDEVAKEFCERVLAAYAGPSSWHDRLWAAGWAAMRFLLVAERKNSRRMRLEQILLLAVRCAMLLLLVLAMASVTPWAEALWYKLFPDSAVLAAASGQRTHKVLVLDGSLTSPESRAGTERGIRR